MDYFSKVLHHGPSSNSSVVEILSNVHNNPIVKLEYLYFPLKLVKRQKREKKISMQRIEDGNVSFVLDFVSPEYRRQVAAVHVGVKRTNESSSSDRCIGCIPIKQIDLAYVQETKILVKVDLDSVHTYQGKKVYELDRAREELNLFHLIIDIQFVNGEIMTQNTRPFKLIGRKCTGTGVGKRLSTDSPSRSSSVSTEPSMETSVIQAVPPPALKDESSAESGYGSPPPLTSQLSQNRRSRDLLEVCTVVAEHIKTKFLDLDGESIINLNYIQKIKTPNGDIAYHFRLENNSDTFVEGEVVGIVTSEGYGERRQVIRKLTHLNSSYTVLKGVITRSHYLEARKPLDGVCTETIAMMGIVPVQVHGSVVTNDALYASPHHPGFAVSGQHLHPCMANEASFIGYAFSSNNTPADDGTCPKGKVEAAVSLLQSTGFRLIQDKFQNLEQNFHKEIKDMKNRRRNTRKCLCGGALVCCLVVLLLFTCVYQLLSKGSTYHYYRCGQGRKQPYHDSHFFFSPFTQQQRQHQQHYESWRVNGMEFSLEELMRKTYRYDYNHLNGTGFRYYLNIDHCVSTNPHQFDIFPWDQDWRQVIGPPIFAIDSQCQNVYFYQHSPLQKQTWVRYTTVAHTDVHCTSSSTSSSSSSSSSDRNIANGVQVT